MKTKEELKQLAIDIYKGRVFTDRQVKDNNDLLMIFLPLALGAFNTHDLDNIQKEAKEKEISNIVMIYEYMDKAMSRGINGYPCFGSFHMLFKDEYPLLLEYYEKYSDLQKEFKDMDKKGGEC